VEIHIFDRQKSLKIDQSQVRAVVKNVLEVEDKSCDEVSVHFIDNETMCALHEKYFNDPSPTDCISFPIDAPETEGCILGDLFVCTDAAVEYDGESYGETTLYLVHSLLHLLGYDDIEPEDIRVMREAESRHMKALAEKNAILSYT